MFVSEATPLAFTGYSARHLPSWIVTKGGHTPTWEVFPPPRCDLTVV
jgi:hypothetical protein